MSQPHEVIVVDDASSDSTSEIAGRFDVTVLTLNNKPEGWIGKSWACQNGVNAASGDLLLFIDADVRLEPDALARLLTAYNGCTISVQPWHETFEYYEQFSMLFNLVQAAATGTTMPKTEGNGLYGPLILMPRNVYEQIGGHEAVRGSIIEDMALARQLKNHSLPFRLYVGDRTIRYRMYAGGFKSLFEGWVKNAAWGATTIPLWHFVLVFLWVTSLTSVPYHLLVYSIARSLPGIAVYGALYIIWLIILRFLSKKFGKFKACATFLYPVGLAVMLLIYLVSLTKKLLRLPVSWRGRVIGEERL
ncbi:MAG: glycosyltransferase [Ruminococcaceae bacterium]|nr:glycosyltransferase [Oscillospiraceae bacterium]